MSKINPDKDKRATAIPTVYSYKKLAKLKDGDSPGPNTDTRVLNKIPNTTALQETSGTRIGDLRQRLKDIKRQNNDYPVDKKTKSLLNNITQLVDENKQNESGPYSLLFDLRAESSTSTTSLEQNLWSESKNKEQQNTNKLISTSVDKLPNIINFDNKPLREFEYSCENDISNPAKMFNTHSRSELCLQLKPHVFSRVETNFSPMDHSLSRANEENSLDDSLGILTPDQMDDICYLENAFSPTVEGLPMMCENNKVTPDNGDTPSTERTESNSAASTIQNDGFEVDSKNCKDENNIQEKDQLIHTSPLVNLDESDNTNDVIKCTIIVEDEFLPSIHSSILEPISSIAETTVNLDLPLDCKNENRIIIHRIEQTPSPEDLPLDASDINGEISTYSQFSASTMHESSHTCSETKNDYPKSMETSKVSNSFITSITSVTSLDGYQGDGEMSRPVSRAADRSIGPREDEMMEVDWQNVPVTRRTDPMTDSDFFTESDADGLDDQVHRGDRKAQVIDGALYGGKNNNGNQPLIVNRNDDSCMESSGVYTDLENHRSSPVFLNAIDDLSPEGSTPSTRSECSQKRLSNAKKDQLLNETFVLDKRNMSVDEDVTPKNGSKKNSLNSQKDFKTLEKSRDEKKFTLKKYKMPKRDVPSKLKSMLTLSNRKAEADSSVQNSPKSVKKTELIKTKSTDIKRDFKPKSFKDVKSKVDTFPLQRSQTACSVTRMLSAKGNNPNSKTKSRHMRMRMEIGSANGSGKSSLHSSQSDISASSSPLGKHSRFPLLRNGKKRENAPATPQTPARPPPTPPTPQTQVPAKKNGVVQKLSSSPVSLRARAPTVATPPSPRKTAPRRTPVQRPNTLPTNKEPPRVTPAVGPRGKRAPQAGAPQARSSPTVLAVTTLAANRDQNALEHAAKGVEALGVLVQYLVFRLDALNGTAWKSEAERWRSVAAAERSSAAKADRDRQQREQKDLDTISECLSKISELEIEVSSKEEVNARLQATHVEEVTALANDVKGLKETIETLKREVAESRARLHAHSEIERTLRAQLEAAREECARADESDTLNRTYDISDDKPGDLSTDGSDDVFLRTLSSSTCDAACDPVQMEIECEIRLSNNAELSSDPNELAAEVRSLRAVVELKQAEIAALRDARSELAVERERRTAAERDLCSAKHAAEELRERAAARQREADRLRDDNRRLREIAARDRDHATRLAALNEELRYKLRQKSQVVALLGNGGYIERAPLRARTLSTDSGRSASPAPDSPPSPASPAPPNASDPAPPAVKGVVEKHDSVSWVLEIEESPEEVASRLARKSSFRTGVSPSGVKRRGGGSPGSNSPAPASPAPNASKLFRPGDIDYSPQPPPLKESAGEAIYIYDDRQY